MRSGLRLSNMRPIISWTDFSDSVNDSESDSDIDIAFGYFQLSITISYKDKHADMLYCTLVLRQI